MSDFYDLELINSTANMIDVANQYQTFNSKGGGKCPICNSSKAFKYSKRHTKISCFKCEITVSNAIQYLMKFQSKSYKDALSEIAHFYQIDPIVQNDLKSSRKTTNTFRDAQLKESGIPIEEQQFHTFDSKNNAVIIDRFEPGSIDKFWNILNDQTDMILRYLDLDGNPCTYRKQNSSKDIIFFRVRHSNPNLHLDKSGNPSKYIQPYQSGTHLWLPNKLIDAYQQGETIEILHIDEGEKKASKKSIHGMLSVGIMGIHNIAAKGQNLPSEFQRIIKKCKTTKIVFTLDSDWLDISSNEDKPADSRPYSFFYAVKKFRDYFRHFRNEDIDLDIFLATVNKNDNEEKGVDDLLAGTLAGNEIALANDYQYAMNDAHGIGDYVTLTNISTLSEFKLLELWHLNSPQAFAEFHKESLSLRESFTINRLKWHFDNDELKLHQQIFPEEQFWNDDSFVTPGGIVKQKYSWNYRKIRTFLRNRGFFKKMLASQESIFIRVEDNIAMEVNSDYIREFMINLTEDIGEFGVLENCLLPNAKHYLGPDQLKNMYTFNNSFHLNDRYSQYLFFENSYWHITKSGITKGSITELSDTIWQNNQIPFEPKLFDSIPITLAIEDGKPLTDYIDPEIEKCDFYNFLSATSDFDWSKYSDHNRNPTKERDLAYSTKVVQHFVAKLTAIGYLLHRYRDPSITKAVIAMDLVESVVGQSNGRSGKSILGDALDRVSPVFYINGKKMKVTEDPFLYEGLDERHSIIHFDDIRVNHDFEAHLNEISKSVTVNPKGKTAYKIPLESAQKFLFCTNHSIKGDSDSFEDRQILIGFSNYFDKSYKPIDEFGHRMFDDWNFDQWNQFYNLMATCIHLYLKHGIIEGPKTSLAKRQMRQEMGEAFLDFMESWSYFNLEKATDRKTMYAEFTEEFPKSARYIDKRKFKVLVKTYCAYKDYIFNPGYTNPNTGEPFGGDCKRNSVEYFTISNPVSQLNLQ